MKRSRVFLSTVGFLFGAVLLWHYAHRFIFYRLTVLEAPIRFEQGFSRNSEFTVDMAANYEVAIQYDEIFRSTVDIPTPRDEFTVEFKVRSKEKLIMEGSTASFGDWSGGGPVPWASNRDQVTRYLSSFHAEPGQKYSISLRITSLLPNLVGKNPRGLVVIEPRYKLFYSLRKSLFICTIAGISIGVLLLRAYTTRSSQDTVRSLN
jgi:hypothetical protein